MSLRAGFAEIDITPPIGAHKIGWIMDIVTESVLDPLYARAAVFEWSSSHAPDASRIALVQLDTLSVRWTQVADIRRRISARYGFPGQNILVSATHNHAGPAVSNVGDVPRDETYIETLVQKVVAVFGRALDNLQEAEVGFASAFEFGVAHNRRVLMRDGTARTHGTFRTPDALCLEGPIDPEAAVIAARSKQGAPLGLLVNFACHPTHHGGDTALSAGFPGVLADAMKARGWPITLFLSGASGNLHTTDPRTGQDIGMQEAGRKLADNASQAIEAMAFQSHLQLGARGATLRLPFRALNEDEMRGAVRGAQRFVDPTAYDRHMPRLVEKIKTMGAQPAEVQALFMGEHVLVGIPAEFFVEHALRIKLGAHPVRALVLGHANGMIGYVPTREAFVHGGYEATFGVGSRMAPETGDLLADAAITLIGAGLEGSAGSESS